MSPARPGRAVSLVPSITETLLAWGVEPLAVTRFCEVTGYPTVGGTKNPDLEAIVALAPDVVLMDQEENRRPDAEALEAAGLRVVATAVRSLDDVGPALQAIAGAVGVPLPTTPTTAAAGRPVADEEGFQTVWVPIWRRPWMTIGGRTYASSLLAAAGLVNAWADDPSPYPMVELDDATGRGPDWVLAPSEPYPFAERHRAELERVAPAVFVDGRDLFWWGARTTGALGRLARLARRLAREGPGAQVSPGGSNDDQGRT